MAADLVRRRVAVIAVISPNAALAAKAATTTIPIVFQTGSDPVEVGLVASLNRPGGNLTGISRLASELAPKLLELLRQTAPNAAVIAFLMNPSAYNAEFKTQEAQAAARSLGLQPLQVLNAETEHDIDAAFATFLQRPAGALVIGQDVFSTAGSSNLPTWRSATRCLRSVRELCSRRPDELRANAVSTVWSGFRWPDSG